MRTLNSSEYQAMIEGALVRTRDEHGEKVLLRPDGRIVKLFRRKRLFSSALLRPYAVRFARASRKLEVLGVPTIHVEQVWRIRSIKRDAVVYPMRQGIEFRLVVESASLRESAMTRLAEFMSMLHGKGVYFRALHFGNILAWNDQPLALIDVSEVRFHRSGLSPNLRARNFRPMTRHVEDLAAMDEFGVRRFITLYLQHARFTPAAAQRFLSALGHSHPIYRTTAAELSALFAGTG